LNGKFTTLFVKFLQSFSPDGNENVVAKKILFFILKQRPPEAAFGILK